MPEKPEPLSKRLEAQRPQNLTETRQIGGKGRMHGVGAGGNTNFMRHKDSFLGVKQGKICIFVAHRYSFFFEFAKQI